MDSLYFFLSHTKKKQNNATAAKMLNDKLLASQQGDGNEQCKWNALLFCCCS